MKTDKLKYKGRKVKFMNELKFYCSNKNIKLTLFQKQHVWLQLQKKSNPGAFDFGIACNLALKNDLVSIS